MPLSANFRREMLAALKKAKNNKDTADEPLDTDNDNIQDDANDTEESLATNKPEQPATPTVQAAIEKK
ncbi:hypothetical protein evm_010261 [Chilo suppressalis]|nr:hypothetical protein evm_010261 [Chilo suppressalis]